ncbi:MAG: FKBP-type peptidyl-prolyl cis-trans isomerase [Ignavibacteria bacterium]|nr:FKBP-type peptidyl-prolyl cis-trans isomerase [Ignavibacteria bacterium]
MSFFKNAAAAVSGIAAVALLAVSFNACGGKVSKSDLKDTNQKASYYIGYDFGKNMRKNLVDVDLDKFIAGVKDGLKSDSSCVLADSEVARVMQEFQTAIRSKQEMAHQVEVQKGQKQATEFLKENAKKPGVVSLASGLQYKILKSGNGKSPKADSYVTTHYRGTLIDGTEFDNSYKRNQPARFQLNSVIPGWIEALQLMKEGDKWMLYLPPSLAYGDKTMGPITANSALIFEVELIKVEDASAGK